MLYQNNGTGRCDFGHFEGRRKEQPSPWLQRNATRLDQLQSPSWQNDKNYMPVRNGLREMPSRQADGFVTGQIQDDSCLMNIFNEPFSKK